MNKLNTFIVLRDEVIKALEIDVENLNRHVVNRKLSKAGFGRETHLFPVEEGPRRLISKDIKYWKPIHAEYLAGNTITQLAEKYGVSYAVIDKGFDIHNFQRKSKEEAYANKGENSRKVWLEKYGTDHPTKSVEWKAKQEEENIKKFGTPKAKRNRKKLQPIVVDSFIITREEAVKLIGIDSTKLKFTDVTKRLSRRGFTTAKYFMSKGAPYVYVSKELHHWKKVHSEYMAGMTLMQLVEKYEIPIQTIVRGFELHNLERKSQEEAYATQQESTRRTSLEKYGVEHPLMSKDVMEKRDKTNLERYGVKNPAQSPKIIDKRKKTNLEKYGTEWGLDSKLVREKSENTMQERYGVNNYFEKTELLKEKLKEKYGVDHPSRIPGVWDSSSAKKLEISKAEVLNMLEDNGYVLLVDFIGRRLKDKKTTIKYKLKHKLCGLEFEDDVCSPPRCPVCQPLQGKFSSHNEYYYKEFVESLGEQVILNTPEVLRSSKTNRWIELDLWIKDKNIGFEINGLYYHSIHSGGSTIKTSRKISPKPTDYHQVKSNAALVKGIKLFHIWEYMDSDIVKSKICEIFDKSDNVFDSKNLSVKEVDGSTKSEFLNRSHIDGDIDTFYNVGLFYNDVLVYVMCFSLEDKQIVLSRHCSDLNTKVINGFQCLLSYSKLYLIGMGVSKIIVYEDRDWCCNYLDSVYFLEGFTFKKDLGPQLSYTNFRYVYDKDSIIGNGEIVPTLFSSKQNDSVVFDASRLVPFYNSGMFKFELAL